MKSERRSSRGTCPGVANVLAVVAILCLSGCSGRDGKTVIQNTGSDTMVNVAQAWAEHYVDVDPAVSVEVSGGGSGIGIAALINGTVDIANTSRPIQPEEIEQAKRHRGQAPREFVVGLDALAVYVNDANPLEEVTIEQLAGIYGEGGAVTKWSELGVEMPPGADAIIVVSRQSNSGTYAYFREAILGKGRDFRLGTRDMQGSKDVVDLVGKTPQAIGFSGMGYATSEVKMLRLAPKAGEPAIAPTPENSVSGLYPIARPLLMYTLGEPAGAVREYMEWIHSPAGQRIVLESGYVPLPEPGPSQKPESRTVPAR